jgi:hypothetical protein
MGIESLMGLFLRKVLVSQDNAYEKSLSKGPQQVNQGVLGTKR